jgi:photosystem II stability/assembly factor-like uncharacterized protein
VNLAALLSAFVLLTSLPHAASAQKLDMEKLKGLTPRNIGPAGMSGRVTAIDVVNDHPEIIYLGTASGGLWKSTSGGVDWKPTFDSANVLSIGSIAIVQRTPDVLWVGTGEGNPRNSQSSGNGIYKSWDAGRSWVHLGLDATRNIRRVIVDPNDPNTVFAAASGTAWGENPERGVYKTTDGGKTWNKSLYVNERTGCIELVMDPSNPNKLIASMWDFRRWPYFMKSGGPGSGLYVTLDGGATWTKRTDKDGLPAGDLGKIGLAISPSDPRVVYALVEAAKNALYRSSDGGFKWTKTTDRNIGERPFYFGEIHIDPKNENRLYNLFTEVSESDDGGKTFNTLIPYARVHPDHHAWWIHPNDPNFIIDGNDGGAAITHDRGKTWQFIENLPVAQFYHVKVDNETPYNVYGGMQDNGSYMGPSSVWRISGIRNSYWTEVDFGDGFDVLPDLSNPRYGYAMSQGGALERFDKVTGEQKAIFPLHPKDIPLRFNWNAAIAQDPFSITTIYYGSQFLHKSTDRGDAWDIISPDLTTNDTSKQKQQQSGGLTIDNTGAENFETIVSIAASPVKQGVVWAGTDDGNVQVTTDGGASWTNTVHNMDGVPDTTWVSHIYASTYGAGEAFVTLDNHRRNDWTPYVYHTVDYGKSWERLADSKQIWGYALSIVQDPVEPKLIFLGTEFGMYVSVDAGQTWSLWKNGFPPVSTTEMVIQPREADLVLATFGRSIYILDDIRPLRELAHKGADIITNRLHLFEMPPAIIATLSAATGTHFPAEAMYEGGNKPFGGMITYIANPDTAKKKPADGKDKNAKDTVKPAPGTVSADSVMFEILNADGKVIRSFRVKPEFGVNRTYWDLSYKGERAPSTPPPAPGAAEQGGYTVLPGTYTVRATMGAYKDSGKIVVKMDPRIGVPEQDMIAKYALLAKTDTLIRRATETADDLRNAQKTIDRIAGIIDDKPDTTLKAIKDMGGKLADSVKALMEKINDKEITQGLNGNPYNVNNRIGLASGVLNSSYEKPDQLDQLSYDQASAALDKVIVAVNAFFAKDWKAYQDKVNSAKLPIFESIESIRPVK